MAQRSRNESRGDAFQQSALSWRTGWMSTTGVPSIASRGPTCNRVSQMSWIRTRCTSIHASGAPSDPCRGASPTDCSVERTWPTTRRC